MKTLLVLRHAQAVHSNDFADHDRPLTDRGLRQARRMGRLLRGMPPDIVLCSTAVRAEQTAQQALSTAHLAPPTRRLGSLYDSDVPRHLEALRVLDSSSERVLMVGHNPTFDGFVSQLVRRPITMRIGALAVLVMAVENWESIDSSSAGSLVGLFDPAMLKKKVPAPLSA